MVKNIPGLNEMTIYALSSGPGISGVAVIRVSGKDTAKVIRKLTGALHGNEGNIMKKDISLC